MQTTAADFFTKYYLPNLKKHGVTNVQFRIYAYNDPGQLSETAGNPFKLTRSPINKSTELIRATEKKLGNKRGIAITSSVKIGAKTRFLLLLDCEFKKTRRSEILLKRILNKASITIPTLKKAALLRTKNSYHIASFQPLSKKDWVKTMVQSILILSADTKKNVVDQRYIAHSLMRGYGSLRINSYQGKPIPKFIGMVE